MRTLSEYKAINENQHRCHACDRIFPKGIEMKVWNLADNFNYYFFRFCPTCVELTENYTYYFGDKYAVIDAYCVLKACNGEMTPEQLLEQLKNTPK